MVGDIAMVAADWNKLKTLTEKEYALVVNDATTTMSALGAMSAPYSKITSITAKNVTSIGSSAFRNCASLTYVDLPNATSISMTAFSNCASLRYVNLPNAASVGMMAFQYCTSLVYVDLPEVTSVGMMAFAACTSLTDVELLKAASVGSMAFAACTSLTDVEAPNVMTVEIGAFGNCTSLTSISLPAALTIRGAAFSPCPNLTGISLPMAEIIEDQAFAGCESLENITLPSAKTIGGLAFGKTEETDEQTGEVTSLSCSNLVTVSLPMAETIGERAFSGCAKLAIVSLPSVKNIGNNAFADDENLTALVLPDEAPTLGTDVFFGVTTANIKIYVPGTASGYDAENWSTAGLTPVTISAPSISTSSLAAGTKGALYSQTLRAESAFPIVWSIESGALPDGLGLDAATGKISGAPATTGTADFTLKTSNGIATTKALSITVNESAYGTLGDFLSENENLTDTSITLLQDFPDNTNPEAIEVIKEKLGGKAPVFIAGTSVGSFAVVSESEISIDPDALAIESESLLKTVGRSIAINTPAAVVNRHEEAAVFAARIKIKLTEIPGFREWGGMSDNDRAALLETMEGLFAYEYKYEDLAKKWGLMVGAHSDVNWESAKNLGIVVFNVEGVELNYIVTDSVGEPYAASNFIVVPDDKKDGWILDPVWLLTNDSGVSPGTDPDTGPDTAPSTDPDTDPGTDPDTDTPNPKFETDTSGDTPVIVVTLPKSSVTSSDNVVSSSGGIVYEVAAKDALTENIITHAVEEAKKAGTEATV
ncbi:MAG: leucine-rich repeat protein, partial [Synergistaceae bacterium]|nr:leucine-rich repeat protein [Synergistaceae bacterium]